MSLYVDVHEPSEAEAYLNPSMSEPVERWPLNERGFADYMWEDHYDKVVHVERKTWGELIGAIPKVEDQLRRHSTNQPDARLILILEGMMISTPEGITTLRAANTRKVWVPNRTSSFRIGQLYAWLYQVQRHIEVYFTPDFRGTVSALSAFYKGDQKSDEEHTTFKRHFKNIQFHPNPQVVQLMGVFPNIGEKRAIALIEEFVTVWNVVSATPEQLQRVEGIGPKLSRTMLARLGRPDV